MNVKVWNDNIYPLKQYFKGEQVFIPAKSFIEMEFYEAHEFLGAYHPFVEDASGLQDPKSYKMCRIDREDSVRGIQSKIKKNVCISCAHESPSPEELAAHMKARHEDQAKLTLPDVDSFMENKAEDTEALKATLREEIRAELMAEMKKEKASKAKPKAA